MYSSRKDELLIKSTDITNHQKAKVLPDEIGKSLIVNVVAFDIKAKILPLNVASACEIDLEIEDRSFTIRGNSFHFVVTRKPQDMATISGICQSARDARFQWAPLIEAVANT